MSAARADAQAHDAAVSERAERAWTTSYRASRVLPISGPPIPDGAVVVEGDRIAWVGRAGEEPSLSSARVVELGDAVLAPGFVNTHTHLDLTVLQGLLDRHSFFDWIRAVVACRAQLSEAELLDSARVGVMHGLKAGITTFADTAPVAASFDAMGELGVRGIAYQEVFGPDPAVAAAAVAELGARVAALRARTTRLVGVGVSPHAPYSVSDDLYRATAHYARRERLPIATHIAEGGDESALVAEGNGPFAAFLRSRGIDVAPRAASPVALLGTLGVLGADTLLVHCVRCDANDVTAIARSGAAVATCPRSNAYFAHGVAPVGALRQAGVRVGIGSDSLASNAGMDPLGEAAAALAGEPDTTAADQWRLATLGGAQALGIDARVGSLETGKEADLAAFPLGAGARRTDGYAAVGPSPQPSLVVVAGVELVRDSRIAAEVDGVIARNAATAQRLHQWRARGAPT